MAPLTVLVVAWGVLRLLGFLEVLTATSSSSGALQFALAAMFGFTAASHFVPRTRSTWSGWFPNVCRIPASW
jgi:Na+-translocating ferredoxin:NAD+ oxidoreductase RnfE subunit